MWYFLLKFDIQQKTTIIFAVKILKIDEKFCPEPFGVVACNWRWYAKNQNAPQLLATSKNEQTWLLRMWCFKAPQYRMGCEYGKKR